MLLNAGADAAVVYRGAHTIVTQLHLLMLLNSGAVAAVVYRGARHDHARAEPV